MTRTRAELLLEAIFLGMRIGQLRERDLQIWNGQGVIAENAAVESMQVRTELAHRTAALGKIEAALEQHGGDAPAQPGESAAIGCTLSNAELQEAINQASRWAENNSYDRRHALTDHLKELLQIQRWRAGDWKRRAHEVAGTAELPRRTS